jgi:pimeloyl-ACP methyl ester carboxylesterase
MTEADGQRIFDGDGLRLTYFSRGNDKLFVTFDFWQKNRNGFPPSNPSKSLMSMGWDQLMVRTSKNDWFINHDTPAVEGVMDDLSSYYRDVRALGYSMGGYGAFRFARPLRIRSVMAISPQYSIHPKEVPFDKRYRAESVGFDLSQGTLKARGTTATNGFICVDPFRRYDLRHARVLQRLFPNVELISLGFGGHPASTVLGRAKMGGSIIAAMSDDVLQPQIVRSAHRAARRTSVDYLTRLAHKAHKTHPDWASWALDRLDAMDSETA